MATLYLNQSPTSLSERASLLPPHQHRLSKNSVAHLCDLDLDDEGENRRTIGLLPLPATVRDHELTETDTLRLQQLLVSLEAREISCCIRVFSDEQKSRSGLLIYRGRLIGCLFGQSGLTDQLDGKEALDHIFELLASPGNVMDIYPLTDEMVLAAASLFHTSVKETYKDAPAVEYISQPCAKHDQQ